MKKSERKAKQEAIKFTTPRQATVVERNVSHEKWMIEKKGKRKGWTPCSRHYSSKIPMTRLSITAKFPITHCSKLLNKPLSSLGYCPNLSQFNSQLAKLPDVQLLYNLTQVNIGLNKACEWRGSNSCLWPSLYCTHRMGFSEFSLPFLHQFLTTSDWTFFASSIPCSGRPHRQSLRWPTKAVSPRCRYILDG